MFAKLSILGVLIGTMFLNFSDANACTGCNPKAGAKSCRDYIGLNVAPPIQPKSLDIDIDGFTTEGAEVGNSCAISVTGLNLGKIVSVEVLDEDSRPIKGFKFFPNAGPARSLNNIATFRHSFAGKVFQRIPEGKSTKLRFHLELNDKVDMEDLKVDLKGMVIAVGAATSDGRFSPDHVDIRSIEGGKFISYK